MPEPLDTMVYPISQSSSTTTTNGQPSNFVCQGEFRFTGETFTELMLTARRAAPTLGVETANPELT